MSEIGFLVEVDLGDLDSSVVGCWRAIFVVEEFEFISGFNDRRHTILFLFSDYRGILWMARLILLNWTSLIILIGTC